MRDQCRELAVRIGRDPDELVEWWAERAAIREVDGGLSRTEAERAAYEDLLEATSIVGQERRGPRSAGAPVVADAKRKDG